MTLVVGALVAAAVAGAVAPTAVRARSTGAPSCIKRTYPAEMCRVAAELSDVGINDPPGVAGVSGTRRRDAAGIAGLDALADGYVPQQTYELSFFKPDNGFEGFLVYVTSAGGSEGSGDVARAFGEWDVGDAAAVATVGKRVACAAGHGVTHRAAGADYLKRYGLIGLKWTAPAEGSGALELVVMGVASRLWSVCSTLTYVHKLAERPVGSPVPPPVVQPVPPPPPPPTPSPTFLDASTPCGMALAKTELVTDNERCRVDPRAWRIACTSDDDEGNEYAYQFDIGRCPPLVRVQGKLAVNLPTLLKKAIELAIPGDQDIPRITTLDGMGALEIDDTDAVVRTAQIGPYDTDEGPVGVWYDVSNLTTAADKSSATEDVYTVDVSLYVCNPSTFGIEYGCHSQVIMTATLVAPKSQAGACC
eukprot:CAMPEP_0198365118 /NCGR_PEP_ID=MMETSP1450-20131203/154011_1 /TAXON_ID=753684 ORGANISM="Madagascaria erythrocladiodes, Strain CCMP3234" /NCGR_SAMPLE_ID=MMETSP1450 /ASSEMBLY_ACC=CAM_ASM_001115 /LENGTH=418 /DNA_ID=CAMNT_0044072563 /DNA_START=18 /DNA_END=1271 /DNA_ORIENTATION=+